MELLSPLLLSLKVAMTALMLVLPVGIWLAWKWNQGTRQTMVAQNVGSLFTDTLLSLPLVLPPTVVGYLLLLTFGRETAVGRFLQDTLHLQLLFTGLGAAVAAAVMAFPLFLRTTGAAFATVDRDLIEAARTLGASEGQLLFRVLLPLALRGVLVGTTLAFARALGEFGATLMVAGNIPGETQTLPLALYAAVQNGQNKAATAFALCLLGLSFLLLFLSFLVERYFANAPLFVQEKAP